MPKRMICFVLVAGWVAVNGWRGEAQTLAIATPPVTTAAHFEVATIKPVMDPNPNRMSDHDDGRRFSTRYTTLRDLMMMAYEVTRQQVSGGPPWLAVDEYDIDAVSEGAGQPDEKQRQAMLQGLLAERFGLAFHREPSVLSVYSLEVARGGLKLKQADANGRQNSGCQHLGDCGFQKETLPDFARWLGFVVLNKPVVDKTGTGGTFDFELKWTPDETQFSGMGFRVPVPVDNPNALPGLFTALQEQLGLKLEPQKISSEILVIDHVERPSEN